MPRMPLFAAAALLSAASTTLPASAEGMMKNSDAMTRNEMSKDNPSTTACPDAMAKDGMAKAGCSDSMSSDGMSKDGMSKSEPATNNMMTPPK